MAYPYWIGSQKDLQSRRAIAANTNGETAGIIPQLVGQDKLPPGDTHANNPFNPPNAAEALRTKQLLIAGRSADERRWNSALPLLIGKDQLPPGDTHALNPFNPPNAQLTAAKQLFVARQSADAGNWNSAVPLFVGKDGFPNGSGGQVQRDEPNPSFAVLRTQTYNALNATSVAQIDTPLPSFVGLDKFYDGPGNAPDFDYPNPSFAVVARQVAIARLSADAGNWNGPLPLIGATVAAPSVPVDVANPSFAVVSSRQALVARTAADLGQFDTPLPALLGQDQLAVGAQLFDLPAKSPARVRDYTIAASFPLELLGQDQFAPGEQLSGNAPATARRAASLTEPGINFTVGLTSAAPSIPPGQVALDQQYRTVPRARDYSVTASFFHGLDGQDALTVGDQLSGNAPATARRAVDYTWVQSFPLSLIGQDALAAGVQVSGNAPATAQRARDYSWLQSFALETIGPLQQFPVGQAIFDLPTPAVSRARDYSFSLAFFHGLDGQDAMVAGEQLSGNTPATARRASTLSDPGVNLTAIITAAPPTIPYGLSTALTALAPTGALRAREYGQTTAFFHGLDGKDALPVGRSTAATELPTKAPARARDYSFVAAFPLTLVGKDAVYGAAGEAPAYDWQLPPHAAPRSFALYDPGVNLTVLAPTPSIPVGEQVFDLPTPAVLRARDYSFTATFFHGLDGKDALPSGHSTANTDLPPKTAPRARDYTWLQTAPLYVYQQLPPGASTESSIVPPRGPARSRDYTFLRSLPIHLIGQDRLYGAPGEVPAYDWQLPTPARPRLRDYTHTAVAGYGSGIPARDLIYVLGIPGSAWIVGASPPSSHWLAGLPSQ